MPRTANYLTIPEPCHEDWARMTPTDRGRFCQSCRKEVLDFSTLSAPEILAVLRTQAQGSVCGRIAADTLTVSRQQAEKAVVRGSWSAGFRIRHLLAMWGLPLLFSPSTTATAAAQFAQVAPPPSVPQPPHPELRLQVVDQATRTGIGFAQVQLWHRGALLLTTQTEADGTLRLAVPAAAWPDTLRLTAQAPGFPAQETTVRPAAQHAPLVVALTAGAVPLPVVYKEEAAPVEQRTILVGAISMMELERPPLLQRVLVQPPKRWYQRLKNRRH